MLVVDVATGGIDQGGSVSHDNMTLTQMYWKPALLQLTQIANPAMDDGTPTPCFVDPQEIVSIARTRSSFAKEGTLDGVLEYYDRINCTSVSLRSYSLLVTESPSQVAMMRDAALGHERKLEAV